MNQEKNTTSPNTVEAVVLWRGEDIRSLLAALFAAGDRLARVIVVGSHVSDQQTDDLFMYALGRWDERVMILATDEMDDWTRLANWGLNAARTNAVLLDPSVTLSPDWLAPLLAAAEQDPDIASITQVAGTSAGIVYIRQDAWETVGSLDPVAGPRPADVLAHWQERARAVGYTNTTI